MPPGSQRSAGPQSVNPSQPLPQPGTNTPERHKRAGGGRAVTPADHQFGRGLLAVSLFACAQTGAARREEAGQQLETLSDPVAAALPAL